MSNIIDRARTLMRQKTGGFIDGEDVAALCDGGELEEAMVQLISLASEYSQPAVSGYKVGAVGLGASGALILGANFEFVDASLSQTVHAEQSVVANAAAGGERGLLRIAVSAPPCGHCRQFLNELSRADSLHVKIPGRENTVLPVFLPDSFGPTELGVKGGLLSVQDHGLEVPDNLEELTMHAVIASNASYAPYSRAPGGVALEIEDGTIFSGAYLENAAFNPSLPAFQSAYASLSMAGADIVGVTGVAIAQKKDSIIDHILSTRELVARIAPTASVLCVELNQGSSYE